MGKEDAVLTFPAKVLENFFLPNPEASFDA
jgi:hypothetical protein